MANTLKFGSGQWATKVGSTLAYNDTNGNFKPLPFTFDRSTSATRVNKEGLIEVVSNNEPRIDFKDDANGALLLEPTRTNLITYSEDFSNAYWTKSGSSVVSGFVSPKGDLSAFKLVEDTSTGTHRVDSVEWIFITGGTTVTQSVYVKANGRTIVGLQDNALGAGHAVFNLSTVTVLEVYGVSAKIETLSDGWFRISYTFVSGGAGSMPYKTGIYALDTYTSGTPLSNTYTGDGTSGIYIWGAQLEAGSYATSYIPTQGSIGTRVAESCSQTPPDGIIGQTEGTLFVEYPNIDNLFAFIGLSVSGGNSNRMIIYSSGDNILNAQFRQGASITLAGVSSVINGKAKAALSFSSTESVFYVNGIQVAAGTATIWSGLNQVNLNQANQIGAKVKDLRVYNTRLSNTELQALTKI